MAEIRQFGPVALCLAAMGSHGGANGTVRQSAAVCAFAANGTACTVRHCGLSLPGTKLGQHQVSA
jgi:hypothetical protein